MARIFPFQPYRYSEKAGRLDDLVTQPYDKIDEAMQQRYLAASPYNIVRVILGPHTPDDSESNNVYTRAAAYFAEWIHDGVLVKDGEASLFAYFQEFDLPDSGERVVRKGFIGLGAVEEYSEGEERPHAGSVGDTCALRTDLYALLRSGALDRRDSRPGGERTHHSRDRR
jgi:uncharacterized protein (DUF1015 family)